MEGEKEKSYISPLSLPPYLMPTHHAHSLSHANSSPQILNCSP